ncbi:MAG: aspartate--tRNA ligase [Clostridiales bacterium]|jgi:aspartyl-tRNA synthetase|nr:aspartate--tRNA ligase [Clostridiales bacterium]
MYRTHTCGELRKEHDGEFVTLSGWLSTVRDHGALLFFTLRDHYGSTQIVAADEGMKSAVRAIPRESTVMVEGQAVLRQDPNPNMPTGLIEIRPTSIKALGRCTELLPFEIASSEDTREDLRLKYRYLDLRNPKVHKNIVLRSKVIHAIRNKMADMGFMEIQTPILTSTSPEGARDYIVPSRVHPGEFYALPQAPQQFKQLLMLSGFDKYFQIAPCFRDEDARADRTPGEFYQLDMEMAFAEQEDVFTAIEELIYYIFNKFSDFSMTSPPFPRIKYKDSMKLYGTDKPDLRIPLLIQDVSEVFSSSRFAAFAGKSIKALKVLNASGSPRKLFDRLTEEMKSEGAKGLVWLKVVDAQTLSGSAAKFFAPDEVSRLISIMKASKDDVIFIIADEEAAALKLAGILRVKLGHLFGLVEQNTFKFCWIVDFPMYELNDEGVLEFSHNPFSMPQGGMEALKSKDPLDIEAYQYDIVANGLELSSGAVRNHSPEIMLEAFGIAGYSRETVETRFSAIFNAFKFGAPPHAGIAPGIDRIVMLLAQEPSIREVIAFPMNKSAQDLMMGAPSEVSAKQLDEVHIQIKKAETLKAD